MPSLKEFKAFQAGAKSVETRKTALQEASHLITRRDPFRENTPESHAQQIVKAAQVFEQYLNTGEPHPEETPNVV